MLISRTEEAFSGYYQLRVVVRSSIRQAPFINPFLLLGIPIVPNNS